MRQCIICGKTDGKIINSKDYGMLCNRCYLREKKASHVYPLPDYGTIDYSEDGKPICHICGRAYDKVLTHVWQRHGLSALEYKKKFGLQTGSGIMSEKSKELARQKAFSNYPLVIKRNLIIKGINTRFQKGSKGRTKDQVSEYTLKRLRVLENLEKGRKKGVKTKGKI